MKNRAEDERRYWVFTASVPIENGYLSMRFKPTSPLLLKVAEADQGVSEYVRSEREAGATAAETARRARTLLEDPGRGDSRGAAAFNQNDEPLTHFC